jgi:hypothetical protein
MSKLKYEYRYTPDLIKQFSKNKEEFNRVRKLILESTSVNEHIVQNSVKPKKFYVGDTEVDLESKRLQIWNNSDKLMRFGSYYIDTKVKSPFSLRFEMPINQNENLCLKITTSLRKCEGSCSHRQTPYLWWIDHKDIDYEFKHRFCWECITPLQRKMLSMIEN